MSDKLLTIGEAARLMGVCENTLRDWDIEGKFLANRTNGGHRRYTLDQIRTYVDSIPRKKSQPLPKENNVDDIVQKWETDGYLSEIENAHEKKTLAILLNNCQLLWNSGTCNVLSSKQAYWLTQQGWLRSKLRRMVSIQPLMSSCDMIYYLGSALNSIVISSDAIVANTYTYGFKLFSKANFDNVKDAYADALADGIDLCILERLPKIDFSDLKEIVIQGTSPPFDKIDYMIVPEGNIELFKNSSTFNKVDIYEMPGYLDPSSYSLTAVIGKYPQSKFDMPIYAPYILFSEAARTIDGMVSVLYRCGWLNKTD